MSATIPLPHDVNVEAAVLAGIILRNDTLADVGSVISAGSFWHPGHAAVFKAMLSLADAARPIDPVTLEYQLEATQELGLIGGLEGLGKLADRYASSHHVRHHAEILRELADLREWAIAGREVAELAMAAQADPRAFMASSAARMSALSGGHKTDDELTKLGSHVHDAFTGIVDRAKAKEEVTGIPTGFCDLDGMMSGLQLSDLILLAARPSMGKTAMALNILRHACLPRGPSEEDVAAATPGIIFSMEMTIAQLIERMLCDGAKVDSQKLRVGKVMEDEFRRLVSVADQIHRAPLWISDKSAQRIDEMRRKVSRLRKRGFIPKDGKLLIVVDYLQLCRGSLGKYGSREQEISEISQGLKALAKDENAAVLALAQLGRDVDKRPDHTPMMSDLRESGSLEQDCDAGLFIVRRERYATDPEKAKELEGQAELIIGKQRKGPIGTVRLTYQGKYTRFENAAADDVFGMAA